MQKNPKTKGDFEMKVTKKRIIIFLSITFLLFSAVSASALPLGSGANGLYFRNSEVFINNAGDSFTVDVGDVFWGVLNLNEIVNPVDPFGFGGPKIWPFGQQPLEISGYFATEVVGVLGDTTPLDPSDDVIIFGPTADPNGVLPAGAVMRLFEDSTPDYNDVNIATGFATATDGTPSWLLGMGPSTDGDSTGGYWFSNAPLAIPTTPTSIGTSYAGLNFIPDAFSPDGTFFTAIDDPNEIFQLIQPNLVEAWFNSEIASTGSYVGVNEDKFSTEPFQFISNDPAVVNVIPEPGTIMLLGLGLLGIAGVSRRRIHK